MQCSQEVSSCTYMQRGSNLTTSFTSGAGNISTKVLYRNAILIKRQTATNIEDADCTYT